MWLDIGCGRGDLLRAVRERHEPASLIGVDLLDWLDADLRAGVDLRLGPAEIVLPQLPSADRVLMVETIEHLEAPWTTLRAAAQHVAPGGCLVVTTPNIASARHRLELLIRGHLTAFRPENLPHITPALPHVTAMILRDEGMHASLSYAERDVMPLTGGRRWPRVVARYAQQMTNVSCVISARRPLGAS
jgi:2-polyprenyl-3-methyl-5-hydroxy-6-metoxy-1,4-benzoquinol methylase